MCEDDERCFRLSARPLTLIKPEGGLKEKVELNRGDLKWVMHEKTDFFTHTITKKKKEFLLDVPQQSD